MAERGDMNKGGCPLSAQAFLKFDAKHFDQTFLKFDVVRIHEGAEQHFLSFSKKEPVLRKKGGKEGKREGKSQG